MIDDAKQQPMSKRERRALRKQRQLEERDREQRKKTGRKAGRLLVIILPLFGLLGLFIWWAANQKPIPEEDIVARSGLHWHPHLSIVIKGKDETIPANIGIGAIHKPIHTHDPDNVLHLEMTGRVIKDDIRLGAFFAIWGKQFSSTCILDYCNGPDGSVKMLVNGEENDQFDRHEMHDGDRIEIRYE